MTAPAQNRDQINTPLVNCLAASLLRRSSKAVNLDLSECISLPFFLIKQISSMHVLVLEIIECLQSFSELFD